MDIYDALAMIAKNAKLDYVDLCAYADEDHEGGRRAGFDDWSIDPDEGKLLYALVRALKPGRVLEIGVREGASTAHLLAALTANGNGELHSYDIAASTLVLESPIMHFVQEDALIADLPNADLIFEDSQHGLQYSLELFKKLRALNPRIMITHDYALTTEHGDFHVKEAFDDVFPDGFPITLDGCERGLAVWVNSEWVEEQPATQEIIKTAAPATSKTTRKPRATAKRTPKK